MKRDLELCTLRVPRAFEDMKHDLELCMAAVAQNWQALKLASEEMKSNVEIVVAAMQSYRRTHPQETGQPIVMYGERGINAVWKHLEVSG